ncbi:dihydroorotate dehydrogenase [Paenibacillus aurantiacus]|uniref:Dihydroorotate dehydrogenase n=1 Tax=Paenibacillus aurantiacus TaxID=1936118 RepID=A0ABV5KLB4_9BACL
MSNVYGGGIGTAAGIILVLFILLVIVTKGVLY